MRAPGPVRVTFRLRAAVKRLSPLPLKAPRLARTTTPRSNTTSWSPASSILSAIQGAPVLSRTTAGAPEAIAALNAAVASSGSKPQK